MFRVPSFQPAQANLEELTIRVLLNSSSDLQLFRSIAQLSLERNSVISLGVFILPHVVVDSNNFSTNNADTASWESSWAETAEPKDALWEIEGFFSTIPL